MAAGAIAGAIAGGITKQIAANQRNNAIQDAVNLQKKAAETRQRQIVQQGEVNRFKRLRDSHQLSQRVRVAAAESGTTEASFANLDRQVAFDTQIDLNILQMQLAFNLRANRQQAILNLQQLAGQGTNIHAAASTGAAQGFSTGLQIQSQFNTASAQRQSLNTGADGSTTQ